jgi:hypothetical protein
MPLPLQIPSPPKKEAVPAGHLLEISETSDDNRRFNCNIQVIINGKRPYQDATQLPVQETIRNGLLL